MNKIKLLLLILSLTTHICVGKEITLSDKDITKSTKDLISRITPGYEKQFDIEVIPATPDGEDVFEVCGLNGRILLKGNNPVSLATAFNWYLKYTCNAQVSWFGDQVSLPKTLIAPSKDERHIINGKYRIYFNYCTISYTAPWWNWDRWQREIDFMAMNSINMPLQPIGLDAVWYNTLLEMGFSDLEARSFIVAPAHQAWQWMPNIESIGGPLPKSWIDSHIKLAKQIFARQTELGMTPIQQGFTGYVPKAMKSKYPEASIAQQPEWYGFEGVSQLDPLDPLFDKMGRIFMEQQDKLFGSYGVYAADPFHESTPPINTKEYLEEVGKKIYNLINSFDKDGIIAMQAWSIREPIVTQMPKDKVIVLDLNGSKYKSMKNYWGYPFIVGCLHNFGGRINLHGDFNFLAANQYEIAKKSGGNVVGSGLFMESIEQNQTYYALAFEMPCHNGQVDVKEWINKYVLRAYGAQSTAAQNAWHQLLKTAYSPGTNSVEYSSMIAARPALNVKKSGPNAGFNIPYDPQALINLQEILLSDADKLDKSPIYRFDILDVQRQIMSNLSQKIHWSMVDCYKKKDIEGFNRHSETFLQLLLDLDYLLSSRIEWNFDKWITNARSWGKTNEEKDLFERDATSLVTYWGFTPGYECQQFDYSWREWSGLIRRYYYPRWKQFHDMLKSGMKNGIEYKEENLKMSNGRESFRANDFYSRLADWEIEFVATPKTDLQPSIIGSSTDIVNNMFSKYKTISEQYYK